MHLSIFVYMKIGKKAVLLRHYFLSGVVALYGK